MEPPAGGVLIIGDHVNLRARFRGRGNFAHTCQGKFLDYYRLGIYTKSTREQIGRSDLQEQIERSKYMERILKRTIEGIRLDTKSLARLADALDADASDAKEVEGLVIDDEACTMEPVGDTVTRQSYNLAPLIHTNFKQIFQVNSHIGISPCG